MSGFKNIEVVRTAFPIYFIFLARVSLPHRASRFDLDTIDLSNLNRQFLFQKRHIGQPKAIVARESALRFNPSANIIAIHGSMSRSAAMHFILASKQL